MAFAETLNRGGHKLVDLLTKPSTKTGERALAQPLPAVDYLPVNEVGSKQPNINNAWYRLVGSSGQEKGMLFLCRCGVSNAYLFGKYDLRRELENDHHCSAGCVHIIEKKNEHGDVSSFEQVRHERTDEHGNVIPVGAPHNVLDLLPDHGKNMSDRERDKVYATLPTWRLYDMKPQPPFLQVGEEDSSVQWAGNAPLGADGRWV